MRKRKLNNLEEEKHGLWTAESIPDWVLLLSHVLVVGLTLFISLFW